MLSYNGLIRTALHHQWGYSVVLVFMDKRPLTLVQQESS